MLSANAAEAAGLTGEAGPVAAAAALVRRRGRVARSPEPGSALYT
jgi:hypothetical protein